MIFFAGFASITWQRMENLKKLMREQEARLEGTSRLLVEKNLELFDQNLRLQKIIEAKTNFVGIASHQLRTPVTEIKWGLDVLIGDLSPSLAQERLEDLEKIRESTKKMIHLIDELLRLVHTESGYAQYHIALHNLEDIVKKVADQAQIHFAQKGIDTIYSFEFRDMPILADAEMIEIVLANLIFNAFFYTPPGGHVSISTRRKDGMFYFEVKDSGIGIPQSTQDAIFQRFHRSKAAMQMNSGGMGLGLYIAKNIVEQHKGEIGFSSVEGKGSTFYFTIPISP